MNPLGNWWFILAVVVLFTPIIWFVTDRVIEPRLGRWGGSADTALQADLARSAVTPPSGAASPGPASPRSLVVAAFAALACGRATRR
jgi:aminobenzoyl-glutamate transport protein